VLVCDLGSDQVYLLNEDATAVVDWIQCEPGFGPRHAVYDPSSERIYVIGEMGHAVVAFPASAGRDTTAIDGSRAHILPPVDEVTAARMDAAEILLPVPGTVFASNRLQHHAPGTENTVNNGEGDTVAVVLYDSEGKAESVKQVRTGCCCVRAMSVSPDGQFVAVAGLCDGGAEVYALSGERKDVWTRAAVLRDITKITTFAWVQ
jgi:6-phosphogluconolactonase